MGWGRETFALALAVQNLVWGATQPFAGMVADRFGAAGSSSPARAVCPRARPMANATTRWLFVLTAGVLIGMGLSGVTYSVVSGVLGRRFPPEKRSMALGISAAAGSFGQFAMLPFTQGLLTNVGWHGALLALAAVGLLIMPLAAALVERLKTHGPRVQAVGGPGDGEALGHRGYVLLTLGFFVCGFQVVFIGVHLPAYLADRGMPAHVAVMALALIGLFNIVGTYIAGWLGGRMPKKYILSFIYFARAVVFALFFFLPLTGSASTRSPRARPAVAVHGSADQLHRRADLRRPLPGDAVGLHVLLAPDRQLPRRVARRKALRHDGQLRHGLVSVDRAGHRRRAHQSADRRARDQAAGGGEGIGDGRRG